MFASGPDCLVPAWGISKSAFLMNLGNPYFISVVDNAKGIKEPDHHADHDHDIQDLLDFPVHGNVGVDQPEQYANYNQGDDE